MGYHRAGFEVVGVDIAPQANYPFTFIQADALEFMMNGNSEPFDAIHASPPCQRYSAMSACRPGLADKYPDLVADTRRALDLTGLPTVIENVPGAPLFDPVKLCGQMFGLELYRHRLFEIDRFTVEEPAHPAHVVPASRAAHWTPGTIMSVSGHMAPIAHARRIMGIDWTTRAELAESIPPAYTEHIGRQLMTQLGG
jgi:DNA (cytosine-5)-methyltransferase 1